MYSVSADRPACLNGRTSPFPPYTNTAPIWMSCAAKSHPIWELRSRSEEGPSEECSEETELIHSSGRLIHPSRCPIRRAAAG